MLQVVELYNRLATTLFRRLDCRLVTVVRAPGRGQASNLATSLCFFVSPPASRTPSVSLSVDPSARPLATMASAVPADLKPIAPYLARANELAKADPPIAYWCRLPIVAPSLQHTG